MAMPISTPYQCCCLQGQLWQGPIRNKQMDWELSQCCRLTIGAPGALGGPCLGNAVLEAGDAARAAILGGVRARWAAIARGGQGGGGRGARRARRALHRALTLRVCAGLARLALWCAVTHENESRVWARQLAVNIVKLAVSRIKHCVHCISFMTTNSRCLHQSSSWHAQGCTSCTGPAGAAGTRPPGRREL